MMKDFFNRIQEFFETVLFVPFNVLREVELENWWVANLVTWIFSVRPWVRFIDKSVKKYFCPLQLKSFNDNNEEDKSISSHSYL